MTAATVEVGATPGVYDVPAALYHSDPVPGGSLSSTGARKLLPPSCPARFDYERRNPPAPSEAMELGSVAHAILLGVGAYTEIDAPDWRTKEAQQRRDAARAEGHIPLLTADLATVEAMIGAVRAHPIAAALFAADAGEAEQTLIWQDRETGVWCRAMLDVLPDARPGRRMVVPDYKTCRTADPSSLRNAFASYGYHQQAAWYLDGITCLGLDDDPAFLFVCQEKTAPYPVTVVELDAVAMRIGRDLNRRAREIYRDCQAAGVWPGHVPDDHIELLRLPGWVETRHHQEAW